MIKQAEHLSLVERPAATTLPNPATNAGASLGPRLLHGIPTVLTLAALAGLAYWGHRISWTMPRFSSLGGASAVEEAGWCPEHNVSESACVECNPDLLPKSGEYPWCKEHGIPACPLEYPEIAQLQEKPRIGHQDLERARRALAFAPRPENNAQCKLHLRRIQFVSAEAVDKAGIQVAPAWAAPMEEVVSANGEITYDQTRVARLSARVPGAVWRVLKQVGDQVRRGDVLALVDAVEVGKAKAEFLQAVVQVELKSATLASLKQASQVVPDRQLREMEAASREAEIRLLMAEQALVNLGLAIRAAEFKGRTSEEIFERIRFLGLPESVTHALDPKTTSTNLIPLVSPLDGVAVAREVVAGEVVDTAKALFVIADLSQMWLTLDVRIEDIHQVALGQPVRFVMDGRAAAVGGKLSWISTSVDERTRTVKVRADLANPDGRLRAYVFGRGQILLRQEENAVVVPNEAVHWDGDCYIVFVRDKSFLSERAPKVFHVRKVRVGAKDAVKTEIIAGVIPREVVATKGSGTLRAELLRNNLGEG